MISWAAVLNTKLACLGAGEQLLAGPTVITTLAISVVWIIYAMIPIWLLIWYTFLGRGTSLHMWCRCAALWMTGVLTCCQLLGQWRCMCRSCCGRSIRVGQ